VIQISNSQADAILVYLLEARHTAQGKLDHYTKFEKAIRHEWLTQSREVTPQEMDEAANWISHYTGEIRFINSLRDDIVKKLETASPDTTPSKSALDLLSEYDDEGL
jgi:hypothetical protein